MALIELDRNPSESNLRWFAGLWFPAFFVVIGLFVGIKFGLWTVVVPTWGMVAVVAMIGVAFPASMRALYLTWMYAAFPIGWTVSHLALGATYYLLMTPIGLFMRLLGHDPLERRIRKDAASYWAEHRPGGDRARYFRQY